MDLLKKILKVILGIALWSYVFAALFIEGTYIPFVSDTGAVTTTRSPGPTSTRPRAKTQRPPKPAVVTEIYAMDLFQEFNLNKTAARRKYKGRKIIVSGLHFTLQKNLFSADHGPSFFVYIEEPIKWLESKSVVKCGVSKAVALSITAVRNPHIIKLKGQVQGFYSGNMVELDNCTLVSLN